MRNGKLSYRPDIDGLRAIAVLAVIANHLPEAFLSSGFLGVDVFFVISGFVVSATILNQDQASFASFYSNFLSRRVKRLVPALIACVAITCTAVFLIDPTPRNSILTGVSALFGVANMTLINFELDYFSPSSKFNAFTHMWSLGVEEQFYVVFPLLVWLTVFARARTPFAVLIALASTVSFAFFLWLYKANQVAAYYLMPTRFWELGIGVLVLHATNTHSAPRLRQLATFAAPGALLGLMLCFFAPEAYATVSTPVAVGLTGLLLFSSSQNISQRVLSLPPVVYVGKISYSLYLWHWPVITLGPLLLKPSWRFSVLYVAAMGVAAIISYHRIERPLRTAAWTNRKPLDIALGFGCSFMLGATVLIALNTNDSFVAEEVAEESFLSYDTCSIYSGHAMTPQTFDQCTIPAKRGSGMPMIWALGDSHAAHLSGLLYELHQSQGFGVHWLATPGHIFPPNSKSQEYAPRKILFGRVMDNLKPGDIVIISRLYLYRTSPTRPRKNIHSWLGKVANLAKELNKKGATLVLTGPPPMFNFFDVRECDIAERGTCAVPRAELAAVVDTVMNQLYALQNDNPNLRVFDLFTQLCPPGDENCYPDDGRSFLFLDSDHLNSLGSKRLAAPFLKFLQASGVLPRASRHS